MSFFNEDFDSRQKELLAKREKRHMFLLGSVAIGVVLIVMLILAFMCSVRVSQGYAGIVYNMNGGVEQNVLGQGWHVIAPWKSVTKYPVSTELAYYSKGEHDGRKADDSIMLGTKDGKTIKVDYQISYHMDSARLPHVFTKFRGQDINTIEYGYMKQNVQRIANDISSHYSIVDIAGDKKPEFNTKLLNAITDFLDDDGIVVEQAGLGKIDLDEQTAHVIQAVANAQYAEKQAQYEKQVAIAQADKQKAVAEGNATAKKLEADAISYYNQKVQQTASKEVVELEAIKKWNGVLPAYMLGSSSGSGSVILNLAK